MGREHSQLFLVRLWGEEGNEGGDTEGREGGDQITWCGKLQHVVSGQAEYFRGWPTLIDLLLEMAQTDAPDVAGGPGGAGRLPSGGRTKGAP
jgi:limonene-1,2-epoxide hydrolase